MFHVIQLWPIKICLKFLPKRKVVIRIFLQISKNHNLNYIGLSWIMMSQCPFEVAFCPGKEKIFEAFWGLKVGWRQPEGQIGWFVMFDENKLLRDKFPGNQMELGWYRKYMKYIISIDWCFTTILTEQKHRCPEFKWPGHHPTKKCNYP